jgi:hypothetical protein
MPDKVMEIKNPLVIMFEDGQGVVYRIHPSKRAKSHREYGKLICDLVRHVARAFKVEEDDVWQWVDKERRQPSTKITTAS